MYVKGLCDKKTFLKEKMDGFTTKAEVIAEYNALKAQEKSAQAAHDFKMFPTSASTRKNTTSSSIDKKRKLRGKPLIFIDKRVLCLFHLSFKPSEKAFPTLSPNL